MHDGLWSQLFRPWQPAVAAAVAAGAGHEEGPGIVHMAASSGRPRRTIGAVRRRRPTAAPSTGRPRAEAPRRERESVSSGGTTGSSGFGGTGDTTGGSSLGGGGLPFNIGRGRPGCGCLTVIVVIVIIAVIAMFLFGGLECLNLADLGTGGGSPIPAGTQSGGSTSGQLSGVTPAADFTTSYPAGAGGAQGTAGQTWLVMLYQDADDNVLEKDIYLDLNEAEKAGSSDRVTIVAQIDRYQGGYSGDGNWTGAKRFVVVPDDDLSRVSSQVAEDLGEVNMASAQTLYDFVIWSMGNFPADKYVLILSDHGMGWPGGWTDPTPQSATDTSSPLSARLGNLLFLNEMDEALSAARSTTGLDKFEIIGLDACLMGQLEVFTALEPHARYAVASEEVEPALGWAYTSFLQALNQNPDMSGAELSRAIVDSYIQEDQTVVDRNARADYLSQNSPLAGLFGSSTSVSPTQMARELGQTSTLSAIDLGQLRMLNGSLNDLVYALQDVNQQPIASSRNYAQSFTNIFGSGVPASYIDLGNFLQLVRQQSGSSAVSAAVDNVLASLSNTIVAEKHGAKKPGATGIAIYYPNSQLYQNSLTGAQSYTALADSFAVSSLWDDFLAFHYTGQRFAQGGSNAVVPSAGLIKTPAGGDFSVSEVRASRSEVSPGEIVTLSADVSGENIGHIYLFVGYYDRNSNSIFVADQDYLEAEQTRQVDGVYYPDWGEGDFTLTFDWEPVVFAVNDGRSLVTSLFRPVDYGRVWEETIYSVDGLYTFAGSGEQLDARAYFVNGVMRQVFGFTGASEASAPREITPSPGDTFTVWEEWMDLNTSGQATGTALERGSTLTFAGQMFTWETLDAAPGEYVVGFIVEDLDGNRQEAFTLINVI